MKLTTLYIIGTPLGNLEDITLRAQKVFRELKHFFAEDTRELARLFNLLGISLEGKKIHSYASHNLKDATQFALEILKSESVGLVTDRGMPAISDPGAQLVAAAREQNIRISPIPGPSAVTTLVSVAGLRSSDFHFVGFLPHSQKEREKLWKRVKEWPTPLCFFESPKRVRETLSELSLHFPSGQVLIGREMTKQFEAFSLIKLNEMDQVTVNEQGEFSAKIGRAHV